MACVWQAYGTWCAFSAIWLRDGYFSSLFIGAHTDLVIDISRSAGMNADVEAVVFGRVRDNVNCSIAREGQGITAHAFACHERQAVDDNAFPDSGIAGKGYGAAKVVWPVAGDVDDLANALKGVGFEQLSPVADCARDRSAAQGRVELCRKRVGESGEVFLGFQQSPIDDDLLRTSPFHVSHGDPLQEAGLHRVEDRIGAKRLGVTAALDF